MAMNKGNVTIDPTTAAPSGSGAAREVFDALDALQDYQGLTGPDLAGARQKVADLSNAVAVMIDHVKANAEVTTTINPGVVAPQVTSGTASSGAILGGTTGGPGSVS